ncbi:MAG: phage major capsid protein [Planctomycetota bacterium]
MALIELTGEATEADVIARINAIITAIRAMDEGSGRTDEALTDLRTAVRTLQELKTPAQVDGPNSRLYERYLILNEGASEGVVVRLYGEVDKKTRVWIPGFLDDIRDERPAIQRELQRVIEDRAIIHTLRATHYKRLPKTSLTPGCDQRIERLISQLPDRFGRAFVDVTGEGAEWIPTNTLPTLLQEIMWMRQLSSVFDREIQFDRDSKLPYLDGALIPYLRSKGVDNDPAKLTPSSIDTDDREFNLVNMGVRTLIDRDAGEDAILPVMDLMRQAVAAGLIAGEEDALLNGDTGTHQDTGLDSWNPDGYYSAAPGGSSRDHRRAWVGIRARAVDVSNTEDLGAWSASPSLDTLVGARTSLKGPKMGPRDAVWIPSGLASAALLKMDDFQTLDKYGPGAVVFTGEIGRIAGVPVIESQFATDDLNASGIHDGVTTTKGSLNLALRSRYVRGVHRSHGVRIETDVDIDTNYTTMVASRRLTYKNIAPNDEKNVYSGYNIG